MKEELLANRCSKNLKSTSSRILRDLSLSSDKLSRRDWSSLASVAKMAFSPYTSPACCKDKETEFCVSWILTEYEKLINQIASPDWQIHNHSICFLRMLQHLFQFFHPGEDFQTSPSSFFPGLLCSFLLEFYLSHDIHNWVHGWK